MLTTDCMIGFAIPLNQEEFFDQFNAIDKDFVRNCCSSWAKYKVEIADILQEMFSQFNALGVVTITHLTLEKLTPCFQQGKKHFTLVAHWYNDTIEFFDRMVSCDEFVNAIPESFDGIIDLCVCTPEPLAALIKAKRPDCSVRYNETKTSITHWIHYYLILFRYISINNVTYNQAFENITKELLKQL